MPVPLRLLFAFCLLTGCTGPQPVSDAADASALPLQGHEIARFCEAVSLAVDPMGRLYVVDAAAATVYVLTAQGLPVATFGGPGSGDRAFVEPMDVDPTNGQVLVVADAGAGEVVRLSNEGRHLETLTPARQREGANNPPEARPIAVAVVGADDLFVLDAARAVVVKWNAARAVERTFGGYDAGAGSLADPVDLAVSRDAVFVADAGRGAVVVYDRYGTFLRVLATMPDVRAVQTVGPDVLVVSTQAIRLYRADGTLAWVRVWAGPEPLQGATVHDRHLFWATPTRLFTSTLPK